MFPRQVLMPLPALDFDPTEAAVPWKVLSTHGVQIVFSTPHGKPAACDQRMITGKGLGIFSPILRADVHGRQAYQEMLASKEFQNPIKWSDIRPENFGGILLPGGHARGMREYLESPVLQKTVTEFFKSKKPVGAICHGVLLAARSQGIDGKSVLFGRKTTALLRAQEISAWLLTCTWLGNYYRTYPQTVESEVKSHLASKKDFIKGPSPLGRDNMENLSRGFALVDGNYISARWPGDAHTFALEFSQLLNS